MTADLCCLGLVKSLEDVVGLFAVSWQHSLLYVVALLLSPLFLGCLHLLPDFSVHFLVRWACFSACVLLLFQLPSVVAQIQYLVCDLRLNLLPLSPKDLFSCWELRFFQTVYKGVFIAVRDSEGRKLSTAIAWNIAAIFGSLIFSRSNQVRGLCVKCLVFSFKLML